VLVAPIMPGINDDARQIAAILEAATEAGATSVGGIALHLRGEVRGLFFEWLREHRPDLVGRYEELYRRGAYVPKAEAERVRGLLRRAGPPGVELGSSRRMEGAADKVAARDPRPTAGARERPPAAGASASPEDGPGAGGAASEAIDRQEALF
jgi:DNA repair photolyase